MVQQESRVKKTLLNARVNLIFYFLTLCLSFFSRKIFLDCLGANFVGLTGTLQNLLGFLNLAELGIGTAISYVLYKPLFDKDQTKINEIISVLGFVYRWIGCVILSGGIILSLFIPLIFPDSHTGFSLSLVYFAFYSFLFSNLISYFINYRQNLLAADQRNYIVIGYYQSGNIIKNIIQITIAYYSHNLYLWILIELINGIIYSFILNRKISRTYPWLKSTIRNGKSLLKKYPVIFVKTKQLFIQKIAYFVQLQTAPFLTYTFVSLQMVAYYTNYALLAERLASFIGQLMNSVSAGVGNLIAEGNKTLILRTYWELMAIRCVCLSIFCFGVFTFVPAFVRLWLGNEYILSTLILGIITLNLFVGSIRGTTEQFIFGYGLFQDVWASVAEVIIYIVTAVMGGHFWGLPGILLGSTVSLGVVALIWKPYFLFSRGFNVPIVRYWTRWIKLVCLAMICFYISNKICINIFPLNDDLSWDFFIFYAVCGAAIGSLITLSIFGLVSSELRVSLLRFKNIILKKLSK